MAIPDWDFTVNSSLLKTFKVLCEDTIYFITQQITTIGIFCLRSDGILRCIFCGVEIERNSVDHFINYNPFINHVRASRNCDYFTRHMGIFYCINLFVLYLTYCNLYIVFLFFIYKYFIILTYTLY